MRWGLIPPYCRVKPLVHHQEPLRHLIAFVIKHKLDTHCHYLPPGLASQARWSRMMALPRNKKLAISNGNGVQ